MRTRRTTLGAPAAGVAPAAKREPFPRNETSSKLGLDGMRVAKRSACGSVVCVRDIALTDAPPSESEHGQLRERGSEPVLDSTGVIPTRASAVERTRLASGDSLADALRSYCEDDSE